MKLSAQKQPLLLELAQLERSLSVGIDTTTEEEKEYDRLVAELSRMRAAAGSAVMAVEDIEKEILRIQEDERKLRRREKDARQQLGAETDPEKRKDLEHDRYTTKSRIEDLMYELKEAHNEIYAVRNNRDAHGAKVDELERQVAAAARAAEAAKEAAGSNDPTEQVEALRNELPEEVLTAYDEKRAENGVGVAGFNGRSCGGCFIQLPAADRASIRNAADDELPTCPNCDSFLVRVH